MKIHTIHVSELPSDEYLNEKKMLEVVAKYSPKSFHELRIYNVTQSELLPRDLESFFMSWKNRPLLKPLTLIVINRPSKQSYGLDANEKNITVIKKYKKLGIVKEFRVEEYSAFS